MECQKNNHFISLKSYFVKTHLHTSCELLLNCYPFGSQVRIQSAPLSFLLEISKVLGLKFAMMTTSYVWILSRGFSNNRQTNRSPYLEHDDFHFNEIPLKQCSIFIFQNLYNLRQTLILIGYKTGCEVWCIATALSLELNRSSCSYNAKSNIHQVN